MISETQKVPRKPFWRFAYPSILVRSRSLFSLAEFSKLFPRLLASIINTHWRKTHHQTLPVPPIALRICFPTWGFCSFSSSSSFVSSIRPQVSCGSNWQDDTGGWPWGLERGGAKPIHNPVMHWNMWQPVNTRAGRSVSFILQIRKEALKEVEKISPRSAFPSWS